MIYTLTSPSTDIIVTLASAKANLRITHDAQDELIQGHIDTAIAMAENYTGRALRKREVTATCSMFSNNIQLRETPLLGDVTIKYRDVSNATQTLDAALYSASLNNEGEPVITYSDSSSLPSLYNRTDAVTISYIIGYTAASVPAPYKSFILLMVTKLYDAPADTALKYRSFANSLLFSYKKQYGKAA